MGRFFNATSPKILGSLIQGAKDGNAYQFGDAHLTDEGFLVSQTRTGRGTQTHTIAWENLKTWNSNGSLMLQDELESQWVVAIPFSTDNAIYLEQLIKNVKRNAVSRISELPD